MAATSEASTDAKVPAKASVRCSILLFSYSELTGVLGLAPSYLIRSSACLRQPIVH